MKKEKKFFRNCPTCDKQMGYVYARSRDLAEAKGSLCASCATTLDRTGRTLTAETKAKIGAAHRGKTQTAEARAKMSAAHKGVKLTDKHRAGLSASKQKKRDAWTKMYGDKYKFSSRYFRKWGQEVRKRDKNTCQKCATKKTTRCSLHSHHIIPKEYFMARALDVDNGISLCASCHGKVHAELDTYVLNGTKLSATDFQNHLKGFINTWPDQKTKQ